MSAFVILFRPDIFLGLAMRRRPVVFLRLALPVFRFAIDFLAFFAHARFRHAHSLRAMHAARARASHAILTCMDASLILRLRLRIRFVADCLRRTMVNVSNTLFCFPRPNLFLSSVFQTV